MGDRDDSDSSPASLSQSRLSKDALEKAQKIQFKLVIGLKEAHDLIAMDKCGTSDPYVKVKVDSQTVYRTKTIMRELDPAWNETCEITLDHLGQKVALSVYDYDRGSISDDFLGRTDVDILTLELDKTLEQRLQLTDKPAVLHNCGKPKNRGYILITTFLQRIGVQESKIGKPDFVKRLTFDNQTWRHTLDVVVANVRDVAAPLYSATKEQTNGQFYLRLTYGSHSNRSKPVAFPNEYSHSSKVTIGEQFGFVIKDENFNELVVDLCHGDLISPAILGSLCVTVGNLSIEQTHKLEERFSDNAGSILMTVTVTGTRPDVIAAAGCLPSPTWTPLGPPIIASQFLREDQASWMKEIAHVFSLPRSKKLPGDYAGCLVLKVVQAKNLLVSDVNGKSDPFCVIEIVNTRLRSYTEYKTLHPKWNRTFIIPISDIHSFMTITVFDDDRNSKPDFLGKMVIPILRVETMKGQREWFPLRSSRLAESATQRGCIELEGHLFYNKPRAIMRALDPKEESYLAKQEKVSIKLLQHDLQKMRKLYDKYYRSVQFITNLMSWTEPSHTITAILVWVITCFIFEPWMGPFFLAAMFGFTFLVASREPTNPDDEQDHDHANEEDSKFSLTDKLNKLQDICLNVHKLLDTVTTLYERIKNIVLWRSPWVSAAATSGLLLISILCFIIPIRWLMLGLGLYELTKKKIRPSAGFEAYDLISRAYTDGEMIKFREPKRHNHTK